MSNRTNMRKMGEHIASLRKKKRYTQRTLGDILDVSDKTISKWEQGIVAPDITILRSLASALDVSVEEILSGKEENGINTIEALDMYTHMTKYKLIKSFIVFLLLFVILIFFVFRIEYYYSWHLESIYSEGDISLKGYILKNNKETKIVVNKIYYSNNDLQRNLKTINIVVKNEDNIIYNENNSFDCPVDISNFLSHHVISIETGKDISKEKLSIYFVLEDDNGEVKSYVYDLK